MAGIEFTALLSFVVKSFVVSSIAAFFFKGYQEGRRAIQLRREGFVSISQLFPGHLSESSTSLCRPTVQYSAIFSSLPGSCPGSLKTLTRITFQTSFGNLTLTWAHLLLGRLAFHHPDACGCISWHPGTNHHRTCSTQIPSNQGFLVSVGERKGNCVDRRARVEILEEHFQSRFQRELFDDSGAKHSKGDDSLL